MWQGLIMSFKLLKTPEKDRYEECIKTVIEAMTLHDYSPEYQKRLLIALFNHYNQYEWSFVLRNILTKIEELEMWIDRFHG